MGGGIAQVLAAKGHEVLLNDVDEARIRDGDRRDREAARPRRRERADDARSSAARSSRTSIARPHFSDLDVELAIEAATERLDLKLDLFRSLDANTPPEAMLATQYVVDLDHRARRGDLASPSASSGCTS